MLSTRRGASRWASRWASRSDKQWLGHFPAHLGQSNSVNVTFECRCELAQFSLSKLQRVKTTRCSCKSWLQVQPGTILAVSRKGGKVYGWYMMWHKHVMDLSRTEWGDCVTLLGDFKQGKHVKQADLDRDPAGAGFTTSSEKLGFLNFADSYPELTIRADNPLNCTMGTSMIKHQCLDGRREVLTYIIQHGSSTSSALSTCTESACHKCRKDCMHQASFESSCSCRRDLNVRFKAFWSLEAMHSPRRKPWTNETPLKVHLRVDVDLIDPQDTTPRTSQHFFLLRLTVLFKPPFQLLILYHVLRCSIGGFLLGERTHGILSSNQYKTSNRLSQTAGLMLHARGWNEPIQKS